MNVRSNGLSRQEFPNGETSPAQHCRDRNRIPEPQLEAAYLSGLPNKSAGCQSLLSQFFTEWFDTAYPSGTATKPDITGPGLAGSGFYGAYGGECKDV